MSGFDKAKDQAEQMKGRAKEKAGEATDNEDLEAEGKREQLTGEAKEAGHDLRDKAGNALKDAKRKVEGDEDK